MVGRYWYDDDANLDCVTTAAGTQDDCSPSTQATPSANLLSDYGYDALNRLVTARGFTAPSSNARYTYDPLDRLVSEWENHFGFAHTRTTTFNYLGLTGLATRETRKDGTGALLRDNTYGYDVYGHRLTLASTTPTATSRYTYGYDVHGSVSLLLDETSTSGAAAASYGYTPYGDRDDTLTKGDTDTRSPINPYRYTGKRYDTGAKTLDMGARHFGPDTGRFLQQDQLEGALGDLGLAADPLTGNRYALAGGNPVSYVEWDGHRIIDGSGSGAASAASGGGSATSPAPTAVSGSYAATREAGAGLDQQVRAAAPTVDPRQRPGAELTKIDPSKFGQLHALCTGAFGEAAVTAGQTVTKSENQLGPLHATCPLQTQRPAVTALQLSDGSIVLKAGVIPGYNFSGGGAEAGGGVEPPARGSRAGAEVLRRAAEVFQKARGFYGGTTSVALVQNRQDRTKFELWISAHRETKRPPGWKKGDPRARTGDYNFRFIGGPEHAEENIANAAEGRLFEREWDIIEGGTSTIICPEKCKGILEFGEGLTVDRQARIYWRP